MCVQQTVIELLEKFRGAIAVHVVADATSSRSQMDRTFAFEVCRKTIPFESHGVSVAVSCGYDTWFAVTLVTDYTTSHFTWPTLGYLSDPTRSSLPEPDTQVSRCLWFPPILVPSISCLRVYMGCALALIFQVRSLNIPCNMVHFQGSISGSP